MREQYSSSGKRVVYLDLMRTFAVLAMMLLHVAASQWSTPDVGSFTWQVFNVYDSALRFCVPVVIMVSGSLFLNPGVTISTKKLYTHNILRLVVAYSFWSILYSLHNQLSNMLLRGGDFDSALFFEDALFGHYHLWFILTLVGIYVMVPIMRKIAEDRVVCAYFLLLSFLFCHMLKLVGNVYDDLSSVVLVFISDLRIDFVLGYGGYFALGCFLAHTAVPKFWRRVIYVLGIVGVVATVVLTEKISLELGVGDTRWYSSFLPTTYFTSAAIFLLFKYNVAKIHWYPTARGRIARWSRYSFGMYLVHDFFNMFLNFIGLTTVAYPALLSVPLNAAIVIGGSYWLVHWLWKIPKVSRYIL